MKLLNDQVLSLVEQYGLQEVVSALSVACERKAHFAADSEDTDEIPAAWETDATTIERIVPLLVNN